MITFGLEREKFCLIDGEVALVPYPLPHDNCGWLVEARGNPFSSPREAVFSLLAEEDRIKSLLDQTKVSLSAEPVMTVGKSLRVAAQRKYSKGTIDYQNLYGHDKHRKRMSEALASTQITIRSTQTIYAATNTQKEVIVGQVFDFPQVIRYLDKRFKAEIKAAKRNPGFYELKTQGMVEYRSLPNTIPDAELIDALEKVRSII
jgi:hypothetical protein